MKIDGVEIVHKCSLSALKRCAGVSIGRNHKGKQSNDWTTAL